MKTILAATALLLFAVPSMAEPETHQAAPSRFEIWMDASSWPALGDLQPLAAGNFDTVGLGLGFALHVPVAQFDHSELLLGVDGFINGTMSNVWGTIDELIARNLYLGASAKWAFGRGFQLDAGLGYHLADMAQVSTRYLGLEQQSWEASRLGTFVGATWDVWAGREDRQSGLFLALKVHFVDFGTVRDEDPLLGPLLGPDAGQLEGPIYMLQVGYSWR